MYEDTIFVPWYHDQLLHIFRSSTTGLSKTLPEDRSVVRRDKYAGSIC
jgi:hypothetical protein